MINNHIETFIYNDEIYGTLLSLVEVGLLPNTETFKYIPAVDKIFIVEDESLYKILINDRNGSYVSSREILKLNPNLNIRSIFIGGVKLAVFKKDFLT